MSDPLPQVGFGCVGLTTLPTQGAALRLLGEAFDGGVRHFDTAPLYGRGYSEEILGSFLRTRKEPVTVTTKFGLGFSSGRRPPAWLVVPVNYARRKISSPRIPDANTPADHPVLAPRRITRAEVVSSFDRSRRALKRDRIDCYLLHEGLPAFLDEDAVSYLHDLKAGGLVGQTGLAAGGINYLGLDPAALAGWDVLQYEFGPAWPATAVLPARFPGHRHIFHSCLKNHGRLRPPHLSPAEWPAHILHACIAANPRGRVLFFSSKRAHVRANLRTLASL